MKKTEFGITNDSNKNESFQDSNSELNIVE